MKRKYNYIQVIQQYYIGSYAWEDVSEYDKPKTKEERELIRHDFKEYRIAGYPTRIINRRVLNQQL